MKPGIGISAYPRLVDTSLGATLSHTTSRFYVEAVERAGGVPGVSPVMSPEAVDDVLSAVHGVLLSGGGDVQPSGYGAGPVAETSGVGPRSRRLRHPHVPAGDRPGPLPQRWWREGCTG